jgi:hypothetical protein
VKVAEFFFNCQTPWAPNTGLKPDEYRYEFVPINIDINFYL